MFGGLQSYCSRWAGLEVGRAQDLALQQLVDMVDKALRDVSSPDKQTCLDVVASSALSDVCAGDQGDTPVDHDGLSV